MKGICQIGISRKGEPTSWMALAHVASSMDYRACVYVNALPSDMDCGSEDFDNK